MDGRLTPKFYKAFVHGFAHASTRGRSGACVLWFCCGRILTNALRVPLGLLPQFLTVWAVGPNSLASSLGERPACTRSIICWRKAAG